MEEADEHAIACYLFLMGHRFLVTQDLLDV
jgi:hypothetical protein